MPATHSQLVYESRCGNDRVTEFQPPIVLYLGVIAFADGSAKKATAVAKRNQPKAM
jgi:hypothetical protein